MQAARAGAVRAATANACLTAVLGAAFLVSKITEWILLVHGGHGFTSNEFFLYYFFLTGIHFLHLLIGFITLGVVIISFVAPSAGRRRSSRRTPSTGTPSTCCGSSSSRCSTS